MKNRASNPIDEHNVVTVILASIGRVLTEHECRVQHLLDVVAAARANGDGTG